MKLIILILAFATTGCAVNIPHIDQHHQALSNFEYVADQADEWRVYDRIDQPFQGDCEDYALTLQQQIGGTVWHVIVTQGHHAVLVADGYVYDNLRYWPIALSEYQSQWVRVMR